MFVVIIILQFEKRSYFLLVSQYDELVHRFILNLRL